MMSGKAQVLGKLIINMEFYIPNLDQKNPELKHSISKTVHTINGITENDARLTLDLFKEMNYATLATPKIHARWIPVTVHL